MRRPELTTEQYTKAIEAIRTLDLMNSVFDDLEACGEQCQQRRQSAARCREHLQELVNRFAPQ